MAHKTARDAQWRCNRKLWFNSSLPNMVNSENRYQFSTVYMSHWTSKKKNKLWSNVLCIENKVQLSLVGWNEWKWKFFFFLGAVAKIKFCRQLDHHVNLHTFVWRSGREGKISWPWVWDFIRQFLVKTLWVYSTAISAHWLDSRLQFPADCRMRVCFGTRIFSQGM